MHENKSNLLQVLNEIPMQVSKGIITSLTKLNSIYSKGNQYNDCVYSTREIHVKRKKN
jgi:hypothetical protein